MQTSSRVHDVFKRFPIPGVLESTWKINEFVLNLTCCEESSACITCAHGTISCSVSTAKRSLQPFFDCCSEGFGTDRVLCTEMFLLRKIHKLSRKNRCLRDLEL